MSTPTEHGRNIADQIQEDDAYGASDALTLADVWLIVDNLHTHFMDNDSPDSTLKMLSSWMRQLEEVDNALPPM